MTRYQKSLTVLEELFGKDSIFSLATASGNLPSVRSVDIYYHQEAFWIVTYATTKKVREIEGNPNAALCNHLYSFVGLAKNVGHPLLPDNGEIRARLIQEFAPWYFAHNNEADEDMCYVKVALKAGFFYKDGTGYKVDFDSKTVEEFSFTE